MLSIKNTQQKDIDHISSQHCHISTQQNVTDHNAIQYDETQLEKLSITTLSRKMLIILEHSFMILVMKARSILKFSMIMICISIMLLIIIKLSTMRLNLMKFTIMTLSIVTIFLITHQIITFRILKIWITTFSIGTLSMTKLSITTLYQ
jgi:hypothetical protein